MVGLAEYFITMVVWWSVGAWEFSIGSGSGSVVQWWGFEVWQRWETRLLQHGAVVGLAEYFITMVVR